MKFPIVTLFALLLVFLAVTVPAATGSVDPTFEAAPSLPIQSTDPLPQQLVMPDGKMVVYGVKSVVDGVARSDIFRLNSDGTLDPTFSYCGCALTSISSVKLARHDQLIVSGSLAGTGKIIRLLSDGSIDAAFNTPQTPSGSTYTVDAVESDGRILATRRDSAAGNINFALYRYDLDGSLDQSLTPITLASGGAVSVSEKVKLLSDGRFYLAVTSGMSRTTTASLRRYNANGNIDMTWQEPAFSTGTLSSTIISDLDVGADGNVYVVGQWFLVNGVGKTNFVRLLPAGNLDLSFTAPSAVSVTGVKVLSDGRLLASLVPEGGTNTLVRLGSDGTADNSFTMPPAIATVVNGWVVDTLGRIVFLAQSSSGTLLFVRLTSDGVLDAPFNPNIAAYGKVSALAVQTDGKIMIAGDFSRFNTQTVRSIVRVNSDGSLDPTFDGGNGFDVPPRKLIVQTDGEIIAIGDFTTYDGEPAAGILRLNTDGSRDGSFAVTTDGTGSITGLALQTDGNILISGNFTSVNEMPRSFIARLNAVDGSVDQGFTPIIACCAVADVVAQPDGKIVIGGGFSGINGFNRNRLVRLNADGSLDRTFNAANAGTVTKIVPDLHGRYFIVSSNQVTRRNNDGSLDAAFSAPTFAANNAGDLSVNALLALSDGGLLVAGRFDTVGTQARSNLVRLTSTGALDLVFLQNGTDGTVRSVVGYPGDKAMIGGDFSRVDNVIRDAVARLIVPVNRGAVAFDINGDGRADFTVYRPSTGVWYTLFSDGTPYESPTFGLVNDIPVPADYDGDGKTDLAIWRPGTGDWWYKSSINGAQITLHWGMASDIPRPADFDGDGKADFVVFRPSTNEWFRIGTAVGPLPTLVFGSAGDQPVIGDFDGDGRADVAIFRPSTGDWWYAASGSSDAIRSVHWGQKGDIPVPADYDGDGMTDLAVFRPSEGGWYILYSSTGEYATVAFGLDGDRPVPADYDGDGKTDIAVFRPSEGTWYLLQTSAGFGGLAWGSATDVAAPSAYLP